MRALLNFCRIRDRIFSLFVFVILNLSILHLKRRDHGYRLNIRLNVEFISREERGVSWATPGRLRRTSRTWQPRPPKPRGRCRLRARTSRSSCGSTTGTASASPPIHGTTTCPSMSALPPCFTSPKSQCFRGTSH